MTSWVGINLLLVGYSRADNHLGIDLVAMSVNDLLVQGAEPLYFLDYFACSKLEVDQAARVIKGIAEGCRLSGCALIGGETAEMPGMYLEGKKNHARTLFITRAADTFATQVTTTLQASRSAQSSAPSSCPAGTSPPVMRYSGSRPRACTRTGSRSCARSSRSRA